MQALADITIRRHDSDLGQSSTIRQRRTVQCYRVVGGNAPAAGRLCRTRADASADAPLIAITLEGLPEVKARHIEVCLEVKRMARILGREIYVCGVTEGNREALNSSGLLIGLVPQNIFPSLNAMLGNFAEVPRHNHPGRSLRQPGLSPRTDRDATDGMGSGRIK